MDWRKIESFMTDYLRRAGAAVMGGSGGPRIQVGASDFEFLVDEDGPRESVVVIDLEPLSRDLADELSRGAS